MEHKVCSFVCKHLCGMSITCSRYILIATFFCMYAFNQITRVLPSLKHLGLGKFWFFDISKNSTRFSSIPFKLLFAKLLIVQEARIAMGMLCPYWTHVRSSHATDTSKNLSDTPHGVSNKLNEKILCQCHVRLSCKLYLKKWVKWSGYTY